MGKVEFAIHLCGRGDRDGICRVTSVTLIVWSGLWVLIGVGREVEVEKKRIEEVIQVNMEHFSRIIGEYVLRYPEQWAWFHSRWRIKWRKLRRQA
ncbi:MAG: hypothetical protein N2234_03300 [Planctomycetota bacterium]|nr:hypothetical protein [Planctomycetota bacterium]